VVVLRVLSVSPLAPVLELPALDSRGVPAASPREVGCPPAEVFGDSTGAEPVALGVVVVEELVCATALNETAARPQRRAGTNFLRIGISFVKGTEKMQSACPPAGRGRQETVAIRFPWPSAA